MIGYDNYLRSTHWRELRARILKRANGRCEYCKQNRATQVHHVTYERLGAEEEDDLRAICVPCHREKHPDTIKLQPAIRIEVPCEVCGEQITDMYLSRDHAHFICSTCGHDWSVRRREKPRRKRRKKKKRQRKCPKCRANLPHGSKLEPHWRSAHPDSPFVGEDQPTLEELERERRKQERRRIFAR